MEIPNQWRMREQLLNPMKKGFSNCPDCREKHFPPRRICPDCGHDSGPKESKLPDMRRR